MLTLAPDRVSRKFAYQVLLQEEFARHRTQIVYVNTPDQATPQHILLHQILSVISEYERAQMAERSRRGKIYRARQGSLNMISRPPYGYDLIRKTDTCGARLVINEAEAKVVRLIFKLYTEPEGTLSSVARQLRRSGYPPRHAKQWSLSTLSLILRNEAYIGKAAYLKTKNTHRRVRHNRTGRRKNGAVRRLTGRTRRPREEWISLSVPAIVDEEVFAQARRQRRANRKFSSRNTRTPTLLQGLCVCALCGYAVQRLSTSGNKRSYYRCSGTMGWLFPEGAVCDNPVVVAKALDEAVWKAVITLLETPDLIEAELERRVLAQKEQGLTSRRMTELERERKRCQEQCRRLLDAYQEGLIDLDALRTRSQPLKRRQREIETAFKALHAEALDRSSALAMTRSVNQFLLKMRESEKALSIIERRKLIRLLVHEVRLSKDQVTICHAIPLTNLDAPDPNTAAATPSGACGAENTDLLVTRCENVAYIHYNPMIMTISAAR